MRARWVAVLWGWLALVGCGAEVVDGGPSTPSATALPPPITPLPSATIPTATPTPTLTIAPPTPVPSATPPKDPVVHLAAVGDLMLDRRVGDALVAGNASYPFANVADLLREADVTVGNLESALGDGSTGQVADKSYTFRAPPEAAHALGEAGFDVLSLANNHALDFGPEALAQGTQLLEAQGIATVGAGVNEVTARQPILTDVNGLRLAFLAYVDVPVERDGFGTRTWAATADGPGMAWAVPGHIREDVGAARERADLVIVLLHSGVEGQEAPSEAQVAAAHAAIDAGAALVIGHHAHVLQGFERYGGGVIAYGLGNFVFDDGGYPESAILNVWLGREGVREMDIVPVIIEGGGQPRLANEVEAAGIRKRVDLLTVLLN